MQSIAIRSASPPRIAVTARAARMAVGLDGSVDRRKLLPMIRRGKMMYFVVRPGDTTKTILRFFGKLGAPAVFVAARQLAAVNRNKRIIKPGAFEEFQTLRPGELLLVPPSWVSPRGSTLRGTLSGLLGEGEEIDGGDVPPGDGGDDGSWTDWFEKKGTEWSNPDQGDNPNVPPGAQGQTPDELGNKFGVFCEDGKHREFSWSFPFVECVEDKAGQACEYVADALGNGEYYYWVGVLDRDGNCTNVHIDKSRGQYVDTGGEAESPDLSGTPCGGYYKDTELAIGVRNSSGKCVPCPSGQAFDAVKKACVPVAGGGQPGGGTPGGKKPAGGDKKPAGGDKKPVPDGGKPPPGGAAPGGIMATLTSPMAKKVAVALAIALVLSQVLGKKKGSRRR